MDYSIAKGKEELSQATEQDKAETRVTRIFGVLGQKNVVIDPDWAKPQEDMDAWLAGDV